MTLVALKSALFSTVLMALITIFGYIIGLGDLWKIDWKVLVNLGVISLLTGLVSLIKNYLTDDSGKALGIQVL